MDAELRAALEAVKGACPSRTDWRMWGDYPACGDVEFRPDMFERAFLGRWQARCAAAHACMYWQRRFEAVTDNAIEALRYYQRMQAWRRLVDILDPMERESAERR